MFATTHTYETLSNLAENKFSLTGYGFKVWTLSADCSGTAYSDKSSVKNLSSVQGATVQFYAQWEKNTALNL